MNIQQMMKQAQKLQAKLQQDMERVQERLADEKLEGSAGGGLVTVTVNGHKQLISVKIAPAAVDPADLESLEDLVFAAVQSALTAAEARSEELMNEVRGSMNIPGLDLGGMKF
jgi:DNA-binding YbaB/EbfC family protein